MLLLTLVTVAELIRSDYGCGNLSGDWIREGDRQVLVWNEAVNPTIMINAGKKTSLKIAFLLRL